MGEGESVAVRVRVRVMLGMRVRVRVRARVRVRVRWVGGRGCKHTNPVTSRELVSGSGVSNCPLVLHVCQSCGLAFALGPWPLGFDAPRPHVLRKRPHELLDREDD